VLLFVQSGPVNAQLHKLYAVLSAFDFEHGIFHDPLLKVEMLFQTAISILEIQTLRLAFREQRLRMEHFGERQAADRYLPLNFVRLFEGACPQTLEVIRKWDTFFQCAHACQMGLPLHANEGDRPLPQLGVLNQR